MHMYIHLHDLFTHVYIYNILNTYFTDVYIYIFVYYNRYRCLHYLQNLKFWIWEFCNNLEILNKLVKEKKMHNFSSEIIRNAC